MAMTDEELLEKVKTGLGVSVTPNNPNLLIKTIAVKQFMLNAGITQDQLESDLGIATLTVGVSDLWNMSPGEVKFSDAFKIVLVPQLATVSMPDL
jgi:hypothetical protein